MSVHYVNIDCQEVVRRADDGNWTMGALAKSLGVSRTTVWKLTGGNGESHRARYDVAERLADALGTSIATLKYRKKSKPPPTQHDANWIGEFVIGENQVTPFRAKVWRRRKKLRLVGISENAKFRLALDVENQSACGHGKLARRGAAPTLLAVWDAQIQEHYLNFEGYAVGGHGPPERILLFARMRAS